MATKPSKRKAKNAKKILITGTEGKIAIVAKKSDVELLLNTPGWEPFFYDSGRLFFKKMN